MSASVDVRDLTLSEEKLCKSIAQAKVLQLADDEEISAAVLRHVILGLPLQASEGVIRTALRTIFGNSADTSGCSRTPVGIFINGGVITGRLDLASAHAEDGGPMCPLEFRGCRFDGGFSGAHGRFARLSFRNCSFRNHAESIEPETGRLLPTVDLSGADIDSDLDMAGVRPDGIRGEVGIPREEGNYLWIKALGVRVAGIVDLSGSHLRAPPRLGPLPSEDPAEGSDAAPRAPAIEDAPDALDLSLARVGGDFLFNKGSHALGRIKGRGAHFRGDAWLSGAFLDGAGEKSLMLQAARIDGRLMLDSRYDGRARHTDYRWFKAVGEIDLRQLELGGELVIRNATVEPSEDMVSSEPPDELGAETKPAKMICLCLISARVGASILIDCDSTRKSRLEGHVQLSELEVKGALKIENVHLGSERHSADAATIEANSLVAGVLKIEGVEPFPMSPEQALSVDLADATLQKLEIRASRFAGFFKATSLDCAGDVVLNATVRGKLDLTGATIGGSFDLSRLQVEGETARLLLSDASIGRVLRLACRDEDDLPEEADSASSLRSDFHVDGTVDLRGLTCDTLDDGAGRLWGGSGRIRMNHFVYRQAMSAWAAPEPEKSTPKRFVNWLRKRVLAPIWPFGRAGISADELEPWEVRRDWIYRQFKSALKLPRPSRYMIRHDHEFRPQPFEQAIRVARAEGSEDFATNFEILKARIQWGLFNRRSRWWLATIAVAASAGWLAINDHSPYPAAVAALATIGMMPLVSEIWRLLGDGLPWWMRRVLREVLFYVPAFLLYWLGGWDTRPLHFAVAFLIFLGIRYISVVSHLLVRVGFGYLRRPVNAIASLILAFVLGWWGVHVANRNHMLVVDAEPVASVAAPVGPKLAPRVLMGSLPVAGPRDFVHDVSCIPILSEPLYALDVLIPLIDLREESRCEVRRVSEHGHRPPASGEIRDLSQLAGSVRRLTLENHRFWALLKAFYAVLGWFIVSLSILTFAQANKTHAEPPTEHK